MVFVAPENTPADNFSSYEKYFKYFSFELSIWQKYAIRAIVDGKHSLVTAPTGSGKTTPAEFAIEYFKSIGKKVIYTSPIKALSNQKYFEFTNKYPDITFGILTGDIKDNPEADVLIMTTEILRNNLYQRDLMDKNITKVASLEFNIDIEKEVGAIVFDEVHYINDPDRGTVWEECFMMSPPPVQLIMLSATIDTPESFAKWIENIKKKEVVLTPCSIRAVPLEHYMWISANSADVKKITDKKMKELVESISNKPILIKKGKGEFNELSYSKVKKAKNYMLKNRMIPRRSGVFNYVVKYLKINKMLPAICFVYSRKNVEIYASEITANLHEDPKNMETIRKESEKILMKLANYKEFIRLPEYEFMIKLLEKGVAVHHSGIIPILREMIEILFSKGYIKLLFATETFSVGLNMPTKTVIFSELNKFDGNGKRFLHSHEYTQQAGRAGRRGFDTKGYVIHLNSMFEIPTATDYRTALSNTPDKLKSKFKLSFQYVLNSIPIYQNKAIEYTTTSMVAQDIVNEMSQLSKELTVAEEHCSQLKKQFSTCDCPEASVNEYINMMSRLETAPQKTKKKITKELKIFREVYKNIENDKNIVLNHREQCKHVYTIKHDLEQARTYLQKNVETIESFLLEEGFFYKIPETELTGLTHLGTIASNIKEMHCLAFSTVMYNHDNFANLTYKQLVGLFSCFTNITVADDLKNATPNTPDKVLNGIIIELQDSYENFFFFEKKKHLFTGEDYNLNFDIIDFTMEWCDVDNEQTSKALIQKFKQEKGIFLGEFIKAILKINNIVSEIEDICEIVNDMTLLSKCKEIQQHTLKYIVVNQSLYI